MPPEYQRVESRSEPSLYDKKKNQDVARQVSLDVDLKGSDLFTIIHAIKAEGPSGLKIEVMIRTGFGVFLLQLPTDAACLVSCIVRP